MFRKHVIKKLSAYCHGELTSEETQQVTEHLRTCQRCRKELNEIKLGVDLARHLPLVSAPASMWNEIETLLEEQSGNAVLRPKVPGLTLLVGWPRLAALSAILLLVVGIGRLWYNRHLPKASWEVARLEGTPKVGSNRINETGRLAVGEWLETDNASRAKINVGEIGEVEVEPNTRIRLVKARSTEHRLALARGTMHATVWAPPRLFFVETPSAVAVDLGCVYTLEVDNRGASLLRVTYGWVAFVLNGRESIVPEGALCSTLPGIGPGTPYFEDASDPLRKALASFDFERGGTGALDVVLAESRQRDTLTLWHLLSRVDGIERRRVYERLASLAPPPHRVTREGVLRLDRETLDVWREELEMTWF